MARRMPQVFKEDGVVSLCTSTKDYRRKLFYALGFYQGLRISEIAGLKPEHIDLKNNLIHIREARTANGKPKKDVERVIPIAPEIREGLMLYRHLLPFKEAIRTMQHWIEKDSVQVLGKYYHAHNLRHSGATHYVHELGAPIEVVQDFLGHKSISCTQVYLRTDPSLMESYMEVR